MTRSYGESFTDVNVEKTVQLPEIRTRIETDDGREFELPDGRALATASIRFHNTHSEELRPIGWPVFLLETGQQRVVEQLFAEIGDTSVRARNIVGVESTGRRNTHGTAISPGETVEGTAMFGVSESLDERETMVLYDASRVGDDRFGTVLAGWRVSD